MGLNANLRRAYIGHMQLLHFSKEKKKKPNYNKEKTLITAECKAFPSQRFSFTFYFPKQSFYFLFSQIFKRFDFHPTFLFNIFPTFQNDDGDSPLFY